MKKIHIYRKSFLLLASAAVLLTMSCEKDDVFTGSPDESGIGYTTLRGIVTSADTEVVSNQVFPVTVSLGDNPDTAEVDLLTFPIDVNVEVIAEIPNTTKRTRRTVLVPAGENSAVGEMIAPSADANGEVPFSLDMNLFLNAITSGPEEDIRGFGGKQYKMVSDTISFGYGTSALGAINPIRFALRFDWEGPWRSNNPVRNNLDILLKKNGSVMQSTSSNRGVATSTSSPLNGTLNFNERAEVLNWLDTKQVLKISNLTTADSIAGIYTIKSQSSTVAANDRPHGYKVGDEVTVENFNGAGSAPLVVTVATVTNPYTFTFNLASTTHLFGTERSFYQPEFVSKGDWSPFLAYNGNEMAVYNGITYYCLNNVSANPAGNPYPNADIVNWTTVRPKFNWLNAPPPSAPWVAGTTGSPQIYRVNQVVTYLGDQYVCTRQHTLTSANPKPDNDPTRWTTANVQYDNDVKNYTSTDTYTMEVYARTLGGVSTIGTTVPTLPYRISVRYPTGEAKVYKDAFTDLTVQSTGSTPPANGIPKMQIVKTTAQGVSTYVVTPL